jgi:hypothetical protein
VTIEEGETYQILLRDNNTDTVELKDILISGTAPITQDSVKIDGAFTFEPEAYDVYSFGKTDATHVKARVMSINYTEDHEVEIMAQEYDANVYSDTTPIIPENSASSLNTNIPAITTFDAVEQVRILSDGSPEIFIGLYWQKPSSNGYVHPYRGANIYYSLDGTNYFFWKYSEAEEEVFTDVIVGETYYFKIVTVTMDGIEDSITNADSDNVAINGVTDSPADVTGFAYAAINTAKQFRLYWTGNTDPHMAGYEVRTADSNWGTQNGDYVWAGLGTEIIVNQSARSGVTYYIKAFTRGDVGEARVYSDTAASVEPENAAPSAPAGLTATTYGTLLMSRLTWSNVADEDIIRYEVYKDNAGTWATIGEKVAEIVGLAVELQGDISKAANVHHATTSWIVTDGIEVSEGEIVTGSVPSVGDKLVITSGAANGQEKSISDVLVSGSLVKLTLSSALTVTPEEGAPFLISDIAYYKVRAVDRYGEGDFSSHVMVEYKGFSAAMLPDKTILARHILVAELSALTANLGEVSAGIITGLLYRTGISGARFEMNGDALYGYNQDNAKIFKVMLTGDDKGDVVIGNETTGKYIKYDASEDIFVADKIQSSNFVDGEAGWMMDAATGMQVNDGTIKLQALQDLELQIMSLIMFKIF